MSTTPETTQPDLFLFASANPSVREARAYGPDDHGAFSTALEVTARGDLTARQAMAGTVRAVTGDLVLVQPDATATAAIASVIGGCAPLFVYRNVRARVATQHHEELPAGTDLGTALGGGDGSRMGFEVVFVPRGLAIENGGDYERLLALIDPAAPTRRLDPAAFYAALMARLAPSESGHPLVATLSRRLLVEVRDEYDQPYAGAVQIQVGSAPASPMTAPASARGTFVIGAPHAAGATIAITVRGSVLTALPSGTHAWREIRGAASPPAHLAVQALFLEETPAAGDESRSWFAPQDMPGLQRYTEGNAAGALRDGLNVFAEYVPALRKVNAEGHLIHVAGWFLGDEFEMIPGDAASTFHKLATDGATAGATVRGLLWDAAAFTNSAQVDRINELPNDNGAAILDNDTLDLGSHHQKLLILRNADGPIAFAGGVDINPDRLDSNHHGAPGPFHDVQAKLQGPAVAEIDAIFCARWNAHDQGLKLTPIAPSETPAAGSAFVQIAPTFPPRKQYTFAPKGALTALHAFIRAIERARKFIYIEDQYLTPYPGFGAFDPKKDTVGITTALREALRRIDYLIMTVPNHTDQPSGRPMRSAFLQALRDVAPDKVHVFYLGREPRESLPAEIAKQLTGPLGTPLKRSGASGFPNEIYCHTKSWIVDDVVARIGSANCNRRSFTHDSELDVVVVDGALDDGARAFARRYRLDLWGELLGLADPSVLADHRRALDVWKSPPWGAIVRPYDDSDQQQPRAADKVASAIDDTSSFFGLNMAAMQKAIDARVQSLASIQFAGIGTAVEDAAAVGGEVHAAVQGAATDVQRGVTGYLTQDPAVGWDTAIDPDGR